MLGEKYKGGMLWRQGRVFAAYAVAASLARASLWRPAQASPAPSSPSAGRVHGRLSEAAVKKFQV